MDLQDAAEAHRVWRDRFRAAVLRHEPLDVGTVSADRACELGQWLHGSGRTPSGPTRALEECIRRHALFHQEAGKVAEAVHARRFALAESMIGAGTAYAMAWFSLADALDALAAGVERQVA
jgi:hypothetical protein